MSREFRIAHRRERWGKNSMAVKVLTDREAAEAHIARIVALGLSPVTGLTIQHRDVPVWSEGWGDQPEVPKGRCDGPYETCSACGHQPKEPTP